MHIGFLGGGHMSRALIAGLTTKDHGNHNQTIHVHDRNPEKNTALANDFGVRTHSSAQELIAATDVLVIAIKPNGFRQTLPALRNAIVEREPLVISVAAGVTTSSIALWLGSHIPIVRAMPNLPSLIGLGAAGLFATSSVNNEQKQMAQEILASVGLCEWVTSDAELDTVTALSGSGPAYFMLMLKAMIDTSVRFGLAEDSATRLAIQTLKGTAFLLEQSTSDVASLIEQIRSPNGTTDRAIRSFATDKLSESVANAMAAAQARAREMAEEQEDK